MLAQLKHRLSARSDSEHEQAALRILIVGLVLGYMASFHGAPETWTGLNWNIVVVLSGFLSAAVAIFAAISIWPAENVPRRLIGMLADNAGATWYMCVAGEYGFSMIGVFLFVTFGNGFRYGRRYLFLSQALCLVGYTGVLVFVPYWQAHRSAGIGLLIALVVLPLYISTLLERIQEARSKAEEANLAKTSFLANMSHEMRTPLNGIVGVVDLLRTTALSAQQGELVGLLRHSISVLRSLVDDVLDITKIEAGRINIEVAPFDLHACINGLMQLLRPHAQMKGLVLKAVVDPALEYRLKGDSHHLRQILLNLLGNAIKFTERGEVILDVVLKQETESAVTARFEVRDTGIGIAPAALSKIFERFVQADQSTTRKYGGTGLGTTIAKQLAELMGGNIGVESVLGQGATFWVELPFLYAVSSKDAVAPVGSGDEQDSRSTSLLISAPGYGDPEAALRTIGEQFQVVPKASSVGPSIDALKASGVSLRAVIAACPIEQACGAFAATAQRLPDSRVAFIYVANGAVSVVDRARVNSINGAHALEFPSPRLIANAIHSATAGADGGSGLTTDLAIVLKRERGSMRVLVAEDNATNQKIIRQLLESAGHEVILAGDGEEALDLYVSETPDMGIFDFNMPHRSGVEVIQAIRMMEPPGTRMPTMILSASVTLEARERARKAGADEFVGKPFDASSLIEHIDRLGNHVGRRQPKESPSQQRKIQSIGLIPRTALGSGGKDKPQRPQLSAVTDAEPALVDASRLAQLEDIARDPHFLAELICGFCTDVHAILERTRVALDASQHKEIPDLMHSLKGAAVGVGATKLAKLAQKLDASASEKSPKELADTLHEVEICSGATSTYLKEYLHTQHHM